MRADLNNVLTLLRASRFPCDEILVQHHIFDLDAESLAVIYEISKDAARMKMNRCLEAAQKIVRKAGL